jgi:hypothetical protein
VRTGRPGPASVITSPTPTSALEGRLCCFRPRRGRDRAGSPYCRGRVTAPDGARPTEMPSPPRAGDDRDVVERWGRAFHHIGGPAVNSRHGRLGTAPVPARLHRRSEVVRASALVRGGQSAADPTGHEPHHDPSLGANTDACTGMTHPLPTIRPSPGSRETGFDTETAAVGSRSTPSGRTIPRPRGVVTADRRHTRKDGTTQDVRARPNVRMNATDGQDVGRGSSSAFHFSPVGRGCSATPPFGNQPPVPGTVTGGPTELQGATWP